MADVGEATGGGLTNRALEAGLEISVTCERVVLHYSVAAAKVVSDRAVLRGIGHEAVEHEVAVEFGSCREADGRGKEEATLHVAAACPC